MIYVSTENRTTRHNAPCPGRIGAGQGTGGDAAIHLDDGIAPLPLQQTFGSSDLLVAAGQIDLPAAQKSGLRDAIDRLQDIRGIAIIEFNQKDIVRHPLVKQIVEAYR